MMEWIEGKVEVYPYEYDEVNQDGKSLQGILGKFRGKKVRVTVEQLYGEGGIEL